MIKHIARDIADNGGRAFYTGGYVRDLLLESGAMQGKDIDIEVFALTQEQLLSILAHYGGGVVVGQSFPVIKLRDYPQWDFTLPAKPDISYQEACARRDFTINAMMMDVLSGEVLDYFGGQADLQQRIIRHTRPEVLTADPLRAYRAVQLAARLDFEISPATLDLLRQCPLQDIKPERILEELRKLLLLSRRPSVGLRYMEAAGILERRHPALFNLIGCPQSPVNHPEGDVWEHTLQVVDIAAGLKHQSHHPEILMFAALLHDIGKPSTTCMREGKITAYGHDLEGDKLARIFLNELNASKQFVTATCKLIREHMHPVLLYKTRDKVSDKAIRKLVNRVNVRELLLLAEADFKGRGRERDFEPVRQWLIQRIESLGLKPDQKIVPWVQGKDLIALGMQPGNNFRRILDNAFEMQLEGKSCEEILNWISTRVKN
jgi:tRNA nucleotidyltransferase (CCA-adding enzyme)